LGDSFHRSGCRRAFGHDDVQPQSNQLGRDLSKRVLFALGKTVLDRDVLALDPVRIPSMTECLQLSPHHRGARAAR
jgi:hypothetical protein